MISSKKKKIVNVQNKQIKKNKITVVHQKLQIAFKYLMTKTLIIYSFTVSVNQLL